MREGADAGVGRPEGVNGAIEHPEAQPGQVVAEDVDSLLGSQDGGQDRDDEETEHQRDGADARQSRIALEVRREAPRGRAECGTSAGDRHPDRDGDSRCHKEETELRERVTKPQRHRTAAQQRREPDARPDDACRHGAFAGGQSKRREQERGHRRDAETRAEHREPATSRPPSAGTTRPTCPGRAGSRRSRRRTRGNRSFRSTWCTSRARSPKSGPSPGGSR